MLVFPLQELAIYLGNQYLNLADTYFVELIESDIEQFLRTATSKRVLIFPPFDSYHRLLVHKVIEVSPVLHSFSIGEGDQRRTVVCLHTALLSGEDSGELMSSPIPEFSEKSKGRGRGRKLDSNSPSPVGRREGSQSSSPGVAPHVDGDVKVRSRPAGRGKAKRPEIQRYVPRGRRQQGEDTRPNETSKKKSVSPRPRETGDKHVTEGHESQKNRRDETPESWDRLADDDIKEPIEDKPVVELTSESSPSPASKKSKTDAESDYGIKPKDCSVPFQTDHQSNVIAPALSIETLNTQSSSIPQKSLVSGDSTYIATLTSVEDDFQVSQQNSNEPSSVSNNVQFNTKVEKENLNIIHNQSLDIPSSDMNTNMFVVNENSDPKEITDEIIGDKQMEKAMNTSCDMDTSESQNVESEMKMEVAESIPEASAVKDMPKLSTSSTSDVLESSTDIKLSNTNDIADIVGSKSENSTTQTTAPPPAKDESISVLISDETSNISVPCQDSKSLVEAPIEPETDSPKKPKKKKDKSKKKGDKKSKTDNDDETVDKPKKKKSKGDKTKDISKIDTDTDIKNASEDTGNEVKAQQISNDERGEGKMKTDNDDEDDWEKMFDDNGDCLEPSLIDELASHVGQVEIDKPKIDYLAYQPKDADLSSSAYHHLIEIYDFPTEFVTSDLLMSFKEYMNKGFDIKWVDDTHAIGVFSSAVAAQDAVKMIHPLFKVRPIEIASKQSKLKAKRTAEFLMPYKERPKTTAMAARRLVSGALGLTSKISKEKSDQERSQLKEAKEKRKNERKLKEDVWDGSVSKCAMDNS